MPDDTSATPSYTMGYSEEFRQMLDQRSAETHAAYLLPHLKPGHRVLDFGCGPAPSLWVSQAPSTPQHPAPSPLVSAWPSSPDISAS